MISIHKTFLRSIWTLTSQGGSNSVRVWVLWLWRLKTSSFHILLQMAWSIQSELWATTNFKFSWRSFQRKPGWKGTTLCTAFSVEVHNIGSCLYLLADVGPRQQSDGGAAGQLARRWVVKHPDTLIKYLVDSLQAYETGHGDALHPVQKGAAKASWVTTLWLCMSQWGGEGDDPHYHIHGQEGFEHTHGEDSVSASPLFSNWHHPRLTHRYAKHRARRAWTSNMPLSSSSTLQCPPIPVGLWSFQWNTAESSGI